MHVTARRCVAHVCSHHARAASTWSFLAIVMSVTGLVGCRPCVGLRLAYAASAGPDCAVGLLWRGRRMRAASQAVRGPS